MRFKKGLLCIFDELRLDCIGCMWLERGVSSDIV